MDTRKFIDAIQNGDFETAKQVTDAVLKTKARQKIENMKKEVMARKFNESVSVDDDNDDDESYELEESNDIKPGNYYKIDMKKVKNSRRSTPQYLKIIRDIKRRGDNGKVYVVDIKGKKDAEIAADEMDKMMGTATVPLDALSESTEFNESQEVLNEELKLSPKDKKVVMAFTEKEPASSKKLETDGKRLDGNWMGGRGIAEWSGSKIQLNFLGSKSAQTVQKMIKREMPRNMVRDAKTG